MRIVRRRPPREQRRRLFVRSYYRCALCAIALDQYEAHHIRYVSLGGTDEDDNLAVLCPTCHTNIAHGLYASEEGIDVLREVNKRWIAAANVLRRSRSADLNAKPSADALLQPQVRGALLAAGAYGLLHATAGTLLQRIEERRNDESAAQSLDLLTLGGSMAYYTGSGIELARQQLEYELARLDPTNEFAETRNECRLALSRLHMSAKDHESERRRLDEFEVMHASDEQLSDLTFRQLSLRRYLGADYSSLQILNQPIEGDSLTAAMKRASAYGELGKAAIRERQGSAVEHLLRALGEAYKVMHRRNLVMTALRLAEYYVNAGDVERATTWWLTANRGGAVGTLPELGVDQVQGFLEAKFGTDFEKQLTKSPRRRAAAWLVVQGCRTVLPVRAAVLVDSASVELADSQTRGRHNQ